MKERRDGVREEVGYRGAPHLKYKRIYLTEVVGNDLARQAGRVDRRVGRSTTRPVGGAGPKSLYSKRVVR